MANQTDNVSLEQNRIKTVQNRIFRTLSGLTNLPKVELVKIDDLQMFEIQHPQQFVPNFRFEWCSNKNHYRIYILLAERDQPEKRRCGYTICTIGSQFAAMGFGVLYGFLHKHRANNKEEAYAS